MPPQPATLQNFTAALDALRNPALDAAFVQRYMGTPRPVLGVKTDALRALARTAAPTLADDAARRALLDALYAGPTFEHRALAGHLLHALPATRAALDLAHLREWIAGLAGWCEIDTTCQNGWAAAAVLARWDEWQPFLAALPHAPVPSLRRAALVLPLAPLRASADARLRDQAFANLDALRTARDPLITKAQSWLLRTLLHHHAAAVTVWLDANAAALPAAVVRETRTKLATGRKSPAR